MKNIPETLAWYAPLYQISVLRYAVEIPILARLKKPMTIVSRQYTMNTCFGFQFRNQTPNTGNRFAAIEKISDCVSVLLNII